jgi:hypothetical protein
MTTSGRSDDEETIFQEGDEVNQALTDPPNRLFELPPEYRLGSNATGITPHILRHQRGSGEGVVTGQQLTEKWKQEFWKHGKTWLNILGVGSLLTLITAVVMFFVWYNDRSNKNAGDIAEIKTEVTNLKGQDKMLREDTNRDIDTLQRQIEALQNRDANNAP